MKKTFAIIALIVTFWGLSAQTTLYTIKGKVVEQDGKTPLPYANVVLKGTSYGDITNTKGVFSFAVPAQYKDNGVVRISFVGYQSQTVALKDLGKPIKLKDKTTQLSEFTKKEYITPEALLKEVIRRYPENYHTDTFAASYYYRDWRTIDDSLYFFLEAPYIVRFFNLTDNNIKFGHPQTWGFCSTATRSVLDTNIIYSKVYRDLHVFHTFYCAWNVTQSYSDIAGRIAFSGGISGYKTTALSQFTDDDGNSYYKIKYYDKKDSLKSNYLFTLIINKEDFAIVEATSRVINPEKRLVGRFVMKLGTAKSIYHNMWVSRCVYRKINGKYLLYRYTSDIDEFMVTKEKYVEQGAAPSIDVRQNIVFQWQGITNFPENDSLNLINSTEMLSKKKYRPATIWQYDTIPQDTLRYGKDWKKGYTIPQLDLEIERQLNNKISRAKQ